MKIFLISLYILSLPIVLQAQLVCTAKDRQLTGAHLRALKAVTTPPESIGDKAVLVGKRFLGTPYVAKTLELGMEEDLVMNLREFDCTTFLENVVVMSALWDEGKYTFEDFQRGLEFVRYRDGKRDGYPSRLHYFSEWITNNEKKGVLTNITQDLGGKPLDKNLNFMSTHREAYKQLKSDEFYASLKENEAELRGHSLYYIPKADIHAIESKIKDGDLIALTTGIKGLDIVHVGFAYHKNGRLHFMHASTGSNKVEISKKPLAEYTAGIKSQSGIMVARLKER